MKACQLTRSAFRSGYKAVSIALLLAVSAGTVIAQEAVNLTSIVYSQLPGGDVQINLVTDGNVGDPGSFSTDNPARIALDFFGMSEQLDVDTLKISSGLHGHSLPLLLKDRMCCQRP